MTYRWGSENNTILKCTSYDKELCFIYNNALQVANEKDKQYQEEYTTL